MPTSSSYEPATGQQCQWLDEQQVHGLLPTASPGTVLLIAKGDPPFCVYRMDPTATLEVQIGNPALSEPSQELVTNQYQSVTGAGYDVTKLTEFGRPAYSTYRQIPGEAGRSGYAQTAFGSVGGYFVNVIYYSAQPNKQDAALVAMLSSTLGRLS